MSLLLLYWKQVALILVVIGLLAGVYHAGGNGPRAELAALQEASEAYRIESVRIAKEKGDVYQKQLAAIRTDWAEWMRKRPAKAPSVIARVCDNESGNRELSDALQTYLSEVGRFRSSVEELLKHSDEERQQLACAVDWAGTLNR